MTEESAAVTGAMMGLTFVSAVIGPISWPVLAISTVVIAIGSVIEYRRARRPERPR